jgi:prepilin-type processing-associated H-X9-DG protein
MIAFLPAPIPVRFRDDPDWNEAGAGAWIAVDHPGEYNPDADNPTLAIVVMADGHVEFVPVRAVTVLYSDTLATAAWAQAKATE